MEKIKNNSFFILILAPLVLCLSTILFYWPSLHYPFQFDDKPNILKFFDIRTFDFNKIIFSSSRWICTLLNKINFLIGKFDPFFYRIFNLTFHIFTGILIFFFFYIALSGLKNKNFFKKQAVILSFFTSILFLLHPVQTQTVSYIIQGRLEGIATFFIVLTCLIFLFFAKIKNLFGKILLGTLIIILTIISTGTKEIAIVLPFLLMLIDWFFCSQGDINSFKKRIPFHLLICLIVFGFYIYFLKPKFFIDMIGFCNIANNNAGNVITSTNAEKITAWYFFISQFKVILHYLFIFIWPFNISVEYDWKINYSFFDFTSFIPFLMLIGIGCYIIYLLKKDKINLIVFGLLWFFISIAPRSSIIPSPELVVDYKTYLASIGVLFIIAAAILKFYYYLSPKFFNKILSSIFLFIIFIPLLGVGTFYRNLVWRSSLEFWGDIIKKAEKSRAYNNYGVELSTLGRFDESIVYFKKSIKLDSHYWDPYTNLASAYAVLGKMNLAIKTLKDSLTLNPYQPEAYNNLGTFFMFQGDFEAAQKTFTAALAMVPHYGKAMLNFGRLFLRQGKLEEAYEYFKKACFETDFDMNSEAFELLGKVSLNLKYYEQAINAFKKVLQFSNNKDQIKESLFSLGNAYYFNQEIQKAINIFTQMVQKFPIDPRGWCNLIEAYIDTKNFHKAMEIIKQAKNKGIYFDGFEIQQAKVLASIGQVNLAQKILNEFVQYSTNNKLKNMAKELVDAISSFDDK